MIMVFNVTFKHNFSYIIYSYKYIESDLIKHFHVIFIHSLGQPQLIK